MTAKKKSNKRLEDKLILQNIEDAWLNIDVNEGELFNPLTSIPEEFKEDEHLYITHLLSRPEYFSFICKEILNVELLPVQCTILTELWQRKFPIFIASRGAGKSFLLAVYATLRALLYPGRKIVICGSVFRQSKVIFEYIESIWRNAPILRDICSINRDSGPRHDVDMWRFHLNSSIISALPIGDGRNIRGQRANDVLMDEFACLDCTSLIETTNGFVRVSDFDRCGILPTGDSKINFEKPTKYIKTPLTDVYEVKLDNGYIIRCSKIHQLMTKNGWKKIVDLKKGDLIEETRNDNGFSWGQSTLVDKKTAWLMGYLISEGAINNKNTISVVTTDFSIAQKLVNDYGFKIYEKDAYTDKRGFECKKTYHLKKYDKKFRKYLNSLGLEYIKAIDKTIPWSILQSPQDIVQAFLSGMFEGDGSCFLWKDRKVKRIGLAYYSVSERLCRDVHILMNKLGYDGYIANRKSKLSKNFQWFIRWNGQQAKDAAVMLNVNRFAEAINNCYIGKFKTKIEGITYKKVLSITKLDKQEHLYDYYLPQTHSFYAEGFRQHNSSSEEIFETVIAGFAAVAPNPTENVKEVARIKKSVRQIER
jgi:intein/homing endonuclease